MLPPPRPAMLGAQPQERRMPTGLRRDVAIQEDDDIAGRGVAAILAALLHLNTTDSDLSAPTGSPTKLAAPGRACSVNGRQIDQAHAQLDGGHACTNGRATDANTVFVELREAHKSMPAACMTRAKHHICLALIAHRGPFAPRVSLAHMPRVR